MAVVPGDGWRPAGPRSANGGTRWRYLEAVTSFDQAVAGVLESLAAGDVVTYGEVAAEAGYPGAARAVGRFLAEHGSGYPWWRVVTAQGRLVPGNELEHAARLKAEGVTVVDGRVAAATE